MVVSKLDLLAGGKTSSIYDRRDSRNRKDNRESREPLKFMIGGDIFFLDIAMHCPISDHQQLSAIALLVRFNLCIGTALQHFPKL